jgi:uncharacterized protein (TIGR02569 family)
MGISPGPARPPDHVLAAFGAGGTPVPLAGGRGTAWRVAELVLKPADLTADEHAWQADVLSTVRARDVRFPLTRRAVDGSLVVDGWAAWTYLVGKHRPGTWAQAIEIGERFHRAIANLPRPGFLATRTDPWSTGDRVAWGESPIEPYRHVPHVAELARALRPIDAPSQLIHGDLGGNVLFADGLPPAVIDLSLYWRPTAFASAIVVADALVWEGADASLLRAVDHLDGFGQYLARGLIYRLVTAHEGGFEPDGAELEARYRPAVELALDLTSRD